MMKKLTSMILAIGLGGSLLIAGCSSNDNKVSDGVNKMLNTTEQLSKAIDSGDQAKVKEVGPKLEDQWSSFEDDVKKDNKDLYGKVEKYLDPTIAGSKAATLDKEALSTLNGQLTDALKELEKSVKNKN
jgi:iron uptake system EfeUOB component EfeO/EfeM